MHLSFFLFDTTKDKFLVSCFGAFGNKGTTKLGITLLKHVKWCAIYSRLGKMSNMFEMLLQRRKKV